MTTDEKNKKIQEQLTTANTWLNHLESDAPLLRVTTGEKLRSVIEELAALASMI